MHKLLVLYPQPEKPAAFRDHYETKHLPLVARLPGLRSAHYAYETEAIRHGEPEFFAVFEADFDSPAALGSALESAAGQAVADDVARFAPDGAQILHYTPPMPSAPTPEP